MRELDYDSLTIENEAVIEDDFLHTTIRRIKQIEQEGYVDEDMAFLIQECKQYGIEL